MNKRAIKNFIAAYIIGATVAGVAVFMLLIVRGLYLAEPIITTVTLGTFLLVWAVNTVVDALIESCERRWDDAE